MTEQLDTAGEAREHLTTIRRGWPHILDPIKTSSGGAAFQVDYNRPLTEDDIDTPLHPRIDTPTMLAFWVHAATDQWPTILQTLQPDPKGHLRLTTTQTINCSDIYAMTALLHRETPRIITWTDRGHDYGATYTRDLQRHAKAVTRIAWPPKGDRMTIGECPTCGRRIRVKAPPWRQVPQPTTNPDTYPLWSAWHPDRAKPITCRCGLEDTLEGWRERIAGPARHLTAEQVVADIREQLGMRYQPTVVRQWARRGFIRTEGYSPQGHALYDRTQVLAALMAREKERAS